MTTDDADVARIALLLDALYLSGQSATATTIAAATLEWVVEWLGLHPEEHFGETTLRHLVAIQLAPRDAIAYDPSNPTPRWRLIDAHLRNIINLTDTERTRIARIVASVLDRASATRGPTRLSATSAVQCATCRLPFGVEPASVRTRDPYKPTWQAPHELCRPEVDHIESIARLGGDEVTNLQIICRACNMAKGAGLILDPASELRYAHVAVEDIPRVHLFRLLQWLIIRRNGRCAECNSKTGEITMRPAYEAAPFARTTMRLCCYKCAT